MKIIYQAIAICLGVLMIHACSSSGKVNKPALKKYYLQPVSLSVSGVDDSVYIKQLFKEAFEAHNVEVITREDGLLKVEADNKRIQTQLTNRKSEMKTIEDFKKMMSQYHRYVWNNMSIALTLEKKDDSIIIYKAGWGNFSFPPDFSRPEASVAKYRELNLVNLSYSLKENVYSIVDSILLSKELK